MWSKLAWDSDLFGDLQRDYPDEREPLAFAAINVCISASSLENWVVATIKRRQRDIVGKISRDVLVGLREAIPQQAMCVAIANTSKHANHAEGAWPEGEVRLDWEDGEHAPPGFVLRHFHGAQIGETFAINGFIELVEHWWLYLLKNSLVDPAQRTPEWRSRKLARLFDAPP